MNTLPENQQESLDIQKIVLKYLSYWKWFLLGAILAFIAAKLYLRYSVLQYRATTTILVKDDSSSGIASELSAFEDLGLFKGSSKDIDDEIEILKSRSLIEKVIKDKNLNIDYKIQGRIIMADFYTACPIKINFLDKNKKFYDSNVSYRVRIVSPRKYILFDENDKEKGEHTFGSQISTSIGDAVIYYSNIKKVGTSNDIFITVNSINKTIDYFKSRMSIGLITKSTNVIEIGVVDPVKEKAEDFLNKLVEFYNNDAVYDKSLISEKTSKFIEERLVIITQELAVVEKNVENYKKVNDITDLETESGLYLETSNEFKKSSIDIGIQQKVVDMVIDYNKKNRTNDIIPANIIPDDGASANLISEYNNLIVERERILKSSTNNNPVVIRVNDKIEALKSSISQSLFRLKNTLSIKQIDVDKQGGVLNTRISKIPRQEREFRSIFRQQKIKEELYLYLFKKREENAISLAVTAPSAKIVDPAFTIETPISPNRLSIYLLALALGMFIPFIVIYLMGIFDTKVKTRMDLESRLSIPFIGDIPHSDSHGEIIQPSSRTSTAEAIRIMRTNLEFLLTNSETGKAKSIFLTSTLSGEGKTFIAINLAATIAISGKKVLLIGLDIRNPKLSEYVSLPERGLTNFLTLNDANIQDYIVNQKGYDHFDILPAGVIPPNPAELLMGRKIEEMFENLKQQYEYIIVDTAPVGLVTDTLLISKNADTFIYVVRAKFLDKQMLAAPETLYKENKLPNMCMVLNDTDITSGYGYGYGYGQQVSKVPWYKKMFDIKKYLNKK